MLMRIVSGLAELLHGGEFESVAGTSRAIDVARLPTVVPREPTRMEVRMNQLTEVLPASFAVTPPGPGFDSASSSR